MIRNTKPPGVDVEHTELAFQPKKKEPKIIYEHGKRREIYMPEIKEQWIHHSKSYVVLYGMVFMHRYI